MARLPSIAITSLVMLLLNSLPPTTHSQATVTPTPTISSCVSRLLPLSPCAPFVQGTVQSPAQMCCVNLKQVYSQQPGCLCLLLNGTTLSSMPINTTLALQLPLLCGLQVNSSICPGLPVPPAPSSTGSPVTLGSTNTNSTVTASPMVDANAPKSSSIMGFGFGRSAGVKLKTAGQLVLMASATAILFII